MLSPLSFTTEKKNYSVSLKKNVKLKSAGDDLH